MSILGVFRGFISCYHQEGVLDFTAVSKGNPVSLNVSHLKSTLSRMKDEIHAKRFRTDYFVRNRGLDFDWSTSKYISEVENLF